MLRRRVALSTLVVVLGIAVGLACAAANDKDSDAGEGEKTKADAVHAPWTEDLQQAMAASKKTGLPIMANFTGSDWCPPCMAQDREVFSTQPFVDWAREHVVLLTVDFPTKGQNAETAKQNAALEEQFKVSSYPTIVFFDAAGNEYGRFGGYAPGWGFKEWVKQANPILEKAGEKKAG